MSGGTPFQNAALLTAIVAVAVGVVGWVVIGRLRRARATGWAEAGSVRSRAQAREIADRLWSFFARYDASPDGGGGSWPRVSVRGAARLLDVLSADDRFDVSPRDAGDECWSFVVRSPGAEPGRGDEDACRQGVEEILARNGVTAFASGDRA